MSASALSPQAAQPHRRALAFGPFVLDPVAAELRSPDGPVALRPRAFDLLCALARRAGELVTKDELLDTVWGTRFVTEGVIKTAIADLRDALGDDPKAPRWIQTVPRRGYRFVADAGAPGPEPVAAPAPMFVEPAALHDGAALVGRDDTLAELERRWREVQRGQRRFVFIVGDPGVGKSALAAAFVERLADARVAHGQCVEAFGQGEPYLPWFEVLASLHSEVDDLPQLLRRVAPAWLAQIPWLQTEAERAAPPDAGAGERMPRQMAELLEQLAQRAPLVVVLEDLHWSDHASVHLLEHLARRRLPARLMVLATFRATELVVAEHPLADLRRELRLQALVHELTLDGLDADATRALLAARHPGAGFGRAALQALHDHTDGVPLFLRGARRLGGRRRAGRGRRQVLAAGNRVA